MLLRQAATQFRGRCSSPAGADPEAEQHGAIITEFLGEL